MIAEKENPWKYLVDATRLNVTKSFTNLFQYQAKVGMHFIGDRARDFFAKDIDTLRDDEGGICK
jgi:hypothetical protein